MRGAAARLSCECVREVPVACVHAGSPPPPRHPAGFVCAGAVYGRLGYWLKGALKAASVLAGLPCATDNDVALFQVPYPYVLPALSPGAAGTPEAVALASLGLARVSAWFEANRAAWAHVTAPYRLSSALRISGGLEQAPPPLAREYSDGGRSVASPAVAVLRRCPELS